jgi:competence protein ComEA
VVICQFFHRMRCMLDRWSSPRWLLRRADQAAVAALVIAALAAMMAWWIAQGGLGGRLIEIDRAPPRTARFEVDINAADWPEVMQLPGIGEVLAHRIVDS